MNRGIQQVIHAPVVMLGQSRIRQPLPHPTAQQISPFILLHHFDMMVEPGEGDFNVPPHPHRGFMPITFMFEGEIEHQDSLGNRKVISNDEVQWISAGRGIIHAEKMSREFMERGGRFHGIQLWINLRAADKMKAPSYQPITKDEIVLIEKNGVQFRLVSGEYERQRGPANSDVVTAMMRMEANSDFTLNFPATSHVIVYVLEGALNINGEKSVGQHDMVYFDNSEGQITLNTTDSKATLLVLSGEPIDEPLVSHGPYVMNTQTEILEAMRDYKDGKMGFLY